MMHLLIAQIEPSKPTMTEDSGQDSTGPNKPIQKCRLPCTIPLRPGRFDFVHTVDDDDKSVAVAEPGDPSEGPVEEPIMVLGLQVFPELDGDFQLFLLTEKR